MSSLFFTKAAALRILRFAKSIEAIRIFNGTIQVTYLTKNGRCSTFLSKSAFYQDFVAFRQEGAKTIRVKRWGAGSYTNHYDCHSAQSDPGTGKSPLAHRTYTVKLVAGLAMCECPDYEKQHQEFGKAKTGCKHVLATLNHVGYGSLAEYMNAIRQNAAASDLFGGGWDKPNIHSFEPHGDFIDDVNQEAVATFR